MCLGIKDYFVKNGFHQAVLGLSGGLDSAVTAALAAEALGPENVLGVLLPSAYSPPHSLEDARILADNLGISQRTIPITPFFHAYLEAVSYTHLYRVIKEVPSLLHTCLLYTSRCV